MTNPANSQERESRVTFLASYPRSGNTWIRIFLQNLLDKSESTTNINNLNIGKRSSERNWFDSLCGFSTANLSHDEVDHLKPTIYSWYSKQCLEPDYIKIHDAYSTLATENSKHTLHGIKCLYIIRNPLDIVVSLAAYGKMSIDETVIFINNTNAKFNDLQRGMNLHLRETVSSWSNHVKSWTTSPDINVHVIRYEDMTNFPENTFKSIVNFLGLKASSEEILKAITNSQFSSLKKQEDKTGFIEGPDSINFFKNGYTGSWKSTLNDRQINAIVSQHKDIMSLYKYLDISDKA
tara:strand:- start:662 stop:1540 length:879 start_codon:yes stop_codon:yes gene_type:complete